MTATHRSEWSDLSSAWTAVTEFTAAVAIYGVLGWFADKWLHTGHVLFFAGLLLGMALGIYIMVKRSDQSENQRLAAKQAARDRQ
ncbi:MAG: AtpZ/AtpI family protein [Mycobacteriales bacterium]